MIVTHLERALRMKSGGERGAQLVHEDGEAVAKAQLCLWNWKS